ncbi:MAG: HD domain-containing protein, partial [Thiovulaceae bacterium]|nr:HD domain-containing protein [Sulfurimonadaceae bacterium]
MNNNFVHNLINSGRSFDDSSKDKYRINFINVILLSAISLFIVYFVLNLTKEVYFAAAIDFFIIISLALTFYFLRHGLRVKYASTIILLFPLPIYLAMMVKGGGFYQSAFFWFFFYPIFAVLLKGDRKGLIWISFLIAAVLSYFIYLKATDLVQGYNPNVLLILSVALILETLVVVYYERIRKRYNKIIIGQNKELNLSQEDLEARVQSSLKENVKLNSELIEIQKDIIFTMGSIGENRSMETANHVKRVAEYTKLFALHLNMSELEADMLSQASPMHDIGKVAIPDRILNKPGKLDEDEFEIMKQHAQLGFNMLKNSNRSLLKMAATIAYEHHEKWDGSGYPNGLKGEDIHICGR